MSEKRREGSSRDERDMDEPPMSRLFVICNKVHTEQIFLDSFQEFGNIEDIWVVKDKMTSENKGVVYIKFTKTSEAAKAMEEMNGKVIGPSNTRPIKVLVASNRHQGSRKYSENEEEKYLRLFVIVPKDMGEDALADEFREYGDLDRVTVIRDKTTKEGKGFAYVKYYKFSHAALAFENCDQKYKAVFAEPKPSRNNSSDQYLNHSTGSNYSDISIGGGGGGGGGGGLPSTRRMSNEVQRNYNQLPIQRNHPHPSVSLNHQNEATLYVICSTQVNQDQLWRIFDIIPGLDYCQLTGECGRNGCYATVVYNNQQSAAYAKEKIHGLEYPPGERLIVKAGLDLKIMGNINPDNIFPFDGSSNELFCSVSLPPPAPMAHSNASVAQRCFIVCMPQALPGHILRQVFSRFGNLIDVYMLPNKNCGYAKYANEQSARKAIEILHGAEVCNIKLKVLEAEEQKDSDERRKRVRRD